MKIENGLIKECTLDELFNYFCTREFDDVMTFEAFKEECAINGVKVIEELNMKTIKFILLFITLTFYSCQKEFDIEKHELRLEFIDYIQKDLYFYDFQLDKDVELHYDYDLFQMDYIAMLQLKGNPTFTFWYDGECYYHL